MIGTIYILGAVAYLLIQILFCRDEINQVKRELDKNESASNSLKNFSFGFAILITSLMWPLTLIKWISNKQYGKENI